EGHAGYLLKHRVLDGHDLADAVRRVAVGETVVDQELVTTLINGRRDHNPLDTLTDREREVLQLMAEGLTDRAIGQQLSLTPRPPPPPPPTPRPPHPPHPPETRPPQQRKPQPTRPRRPHLPPRQPHLLKHRTRSSGARTTPGADCVNIPSERGANTSAGTRVHT